VTSSFRAAFPFWFAYLLPPIVISSLVNRGWFTALPIVVIFGVLPIIDALAGEAPIRREMPEVSSSAWFRAVTWTWVPVQIALIALLVGAVTTRAFTWAELIAATISVGATTGAIGMTFAHELIHRRHLHERFLGGVLLASVTYPHFAIEHVKGHHRNVGTPGDPATARLGEPLYGFLLRSVVEGVASAWQIERRRLLERRRRIWSVHNGMLRYAGIEAFIYAALATVFGPLAAGLFLGQSIVAIVILETINYVEHYGLVRKQIASGEYERVRPEHSWDSRYRAGNWLLINLPRHSDHHLVAAKRYQSLQLVPDAPQLPGGYGAMFLLALAPPLWFRVMNPRVTAMREHASI
jgi:alkane 1-monooxygenase